MTYEEFTAQCRTPAAESGALSAALTALRLDRLNDWDGAHDAAQVGDTDEGAWVHAYLHRKEGDLSNARYWYHRAKKPEFKGTLEEEWEAIAKALTAST